MRVCFAKNWLCGCLALAMAWTSVARADEAPAVVEKAADQAEKPADDSAAKKSVTVAQLTLKSGYPEGTSPPGLFGEISPRLHDLLGRLEKVANDDKLAGLILDLRLGEIGFAHVEELRQAIAKVRAKGKHVHAFVRSATTRDYLVASACTSITVPASGMIVVNGMRAEVMFYKGIFDKLGLQAEFMQVGNFKGAAEPYVRSEMSPELRAQLEGVVDDYYNQTVEMIAKDRKLDGGRVKDLIDEGLFVAERAREVGLIDSVCYEDELTDKLKEHLSASEIKIVRDYGKQEIDTDFSGFAGLVKLIELIAGTEPAKRTGKAATKVAVVYAVGPIMDSSGEAVSLFSEDVVTADETIKALRKADKDSSVKAIVLRVDSPGGSALASDLIWREIRKLKKPVIASMANTAASGGYYISMGCKKIVAEPGTLTGSIGVVGGKIAIGGMLSKFGVNTDVVARGKSAGVFSMTSPFTDAEKAAWMRMMTDIYKQFTSKAAECRGMDLAKLEELAQGKIYTGRQALAVGLVDKLGTLDDAVTEAKLAAGMQAGDKVEVLRLPEAKSFFDRLLEGPSVESRVAAKLPAELTAPVKYLERLQRIFNRPAATVMPFELQIR
jgi:protease-4